MHILLHFQKIFPSVSPTAVRGFLAQKRFKKLTEEYKQDEQEVDAKIGKTFPHK